jgi:GNAT superfamily N-acetyltransferase
MQLTFVAPIPLIASLSASLPEFNDPYSAEAIAERLAGKLHLSLAAYVDGEPAGFKLGYERDGEFYSWLGGVLPQYRRSGVAKALAEAQEDWAREQGYTCVNFKTRNRHKDMLIFALKNGFQITGYEEREPLEESRIWLQKQL